MDDLKFKQAQYTTIADLVIRFASLEKLLIKNNIISETEFAEEIKQSFKLLQEAMLKEAMSQDSGEFEEKDGINGV